MPAAGTFGYGEVYGDLVEMGVLGAVVTHPVSLRPRQVAKGRRVAVRGEHFVVHTGWPNPGLSQVIRLYGAVWARSPVPVIVHLIVRTPRGAAVAARRLSGVPGVAAIELGLAERTTAERACALVEAARTEGDLPVLVRVPFEQVRLAEPLVEAGADALTLTAPPRAVLPLGESEEKGGIVARYMRGRLYGPAIFPLLLHNLAQWAQRLPVPVIACGGIASPEDAQACLYLGATAVQVDALLWRDPALLMRVAQGVQAVMFDGANENSRQGKSPEVATRDQPHE